MGPIVTVTANAALDRTLWVEALRPGRRHGVAEEFVQAGGKGVNVARVLAALGRPVRTVVVVGGRTGDQIEADLESSRLRPIVVRAPGESRTCLEVLEEASGRITQLHGSGVAANVATVEALVEAVDRSLAGARWLALCGSLPRGMPEDLPARLIERARRRGVRTALDARGPALCRGVAAAPDLVRVNRAEIVDLLGRSRPLPPRDRARLGPAEWTAVSGGPREVIAWSRHGQTLRLRPPPVRARNPIGCGDSMLAGMLAALADGADMAAALRLGVAVGAADAEARCAARPDPGRILELVGSDTSARS